MASKWFVRVAVLAALGLSVGCQRWCNTHYPCQTQQPVCCQPCGTTGYVSPPPPPVPVPPVQTGFNNPAGRMNCTCTPVP